ncbi:VOC family protein [Streptomyces sp. PT12]|uniref:VOC family protein n=1 Tax=Streptomyces sp. PT12 TaxID=1510197 RepID=UPI000DE45CA7|nr:VOC family protein [Streptomyces sp. PT12]RBM16159.1 hypothetical protein DEH69_17360 [Streptomyces sp. PT12]
MARILDIVVDCGHPAPLARFWAVALDGYAVAPYDEAELARLRALGARVAEERETLTALCDPEGNEFCLMRP